MSGSRVVAAARRLQLLVVSSTYIRSQAGQLSAREMFWTDYASRKPRAGDFGSQLYTQDPRHGAPLAEPNYLHNPIRRPKSTPRSYAPECFIQTVAYRKVQSGAQVISPGLISKRVDSVCSPAVADSCSSSRSPRKCNRSPRKKRKKSGSR